MVLRGAQFQRSGPARYAFVTRQAFSSYRAMFVQRQFDAACPKGGIRIPRRHPMRFHGGEISPGYLTKDSRPRARER